MGLRQAEYTVSHYPTEHTVFLIDLDGVLSITNDAERVCKRVNAEWPGVRIFYKDSSGDWDELAHRSGEFTGFVTIGPTDRQRFAEFLT